MFKRRPRIQIKSVHKHMGVDGSQLYEITPETYAGPWTLPKGTVLEIVSQPKEKK